MDRLPAELVDPGIAPGLACAHLSSFPRISSSRHDRRLSSSNRLSSAGDTVPLTIPPRRSWPFNSWRKAVQNREYHVSSVRFFIGSCSDVGAAHFANAARYRSAAPRGKSAAEAPGFAGDKKSGGGNSSELAPSFRKFAASLDMRSRISRSARPSGFNTLRPSSASSSPRNSSRKAGIRPKSFQSTSSHSATNALASAMRNALYTCGRSASANSNGVPVCNDCSISNFARSGACARMADSAGMCGAVRVLCGESPASQPASPIAIRFGTRSIQC
jgi:hypothetical protein